MPPDPFLSRRQFLGAGVALGSAALASSLASPAFGELVRPPCNGRLSEIEHIVILTQENRSFDEFFGTFPGVRGFDDTRNRQAFAQPGYHGRGSRHGHLLPFHMDGRTPLGQCFGDESRPTHAWGPQHRSWNGGRNNHFYKSHAIPLWDGQLAVNVMGYYEEQDIPYFWALAREFTLCDMYFSSVLGPTQPNRLYSVSATIDPDGKRGGPNVATDDRGQFMFGDYRWTTMAEQLQARGISWKNYTSPIAGQLVNPFATFRRFRNDPKLGALGIKPTYPNDFQADLDRDELPAVSWVQPAFTQSEHPSFPPATGEYAINQVLGAIWARPHIWRKTVVVISHDENGGMFDHVAPPTPPPGTKGEYLTVRKLPLLAFGIRGPIGLGFRVPAIIVSPWTRGGFISSDTFDHTSVLRLIERRFGAEVPNLSAWRRSVTGDLTAAFNFAGRPDYSIPNLPRTSITSKLVTTGQCGPKAPPPGPYPLPKRISMPRQLPGRARRPSGVC